MKKETRRALEDRAFKWIGAPLAALVLRILAWTTRIRFKNWQEYLAAMAERRPVIFIFWHEDLIATVVHYVRAHRGRLAVMVSRSRDGEKLAEVVERLGMTPVRASSSRGAVAGVIELLRFLREPESRPHKPPSSIALALDGPRGPRHVAKPGVSLIARKANALVIPVAYSHSREIVFKSWDRTRLPLPFGRTTIRVGMPIDPQESQGDDLSFTALLQQRLHELNSFRCKK